MIRLRSFLPVLYLVSYIILQSIASDTVNNSTKNPVVSNSTNPSSTLSTTVPSSTSTATETATIGVPCTCAVDEIETKLKDNATSTYNDRTKQTVQQGILRFSLLFDEIVSTSKEKDKNSNVLFAPVNILKILATLLLGSESVAKDEILDLLGFSAGKDLSDKEHTIHDILGNLFNNFTYEGAHSPAVKVKISQSIFYQNGTKLKEDFIEFAKHFYNNEIINLNFASGDNSAVDTINQWVLNRTEKRITEIVKPPLPLNTKLILLNTLFFNGEWDEPFFVNSTLKEFYAEKGTVKVRTMSNHGGNVYFYYNSTNSYTVMGIPYKGGDTVMYVILPDRGHKLKTILSKITPQDLLHIINTTERDTEASYTLPYLHLSENVGLKATLEKLGVHNIFDPAKANLSKISEDAGLYVSEALHNVNLDVTEAGSTGAAATAVFIETKFPSKKILLVNRPFSFFIIHRPSGIVSFWGTINNPSIRH